MKRTWMVKLGKAALPFLVLFFAPVFPPRALAAPLSGERLQTVEIHTSVQNSTVEFVAETRGLDPARTYRLRADVGGMGGSRLFLSEALRPDGAGRLRFTSKWRDALPWDTDSPQNRYRATLILSDADGRMLDALTPVSFGFREFIFRGREILLNGNVIHLRALRDDSLFSGAEKLDVSSLRERLRKIRAFGFNALFADPGFVSRNGAGGVSALLPLCDETGMLLVVPSLDKREDFVRNHPAVLAYAKDAVETVDTNPGWVSCQERSDGCERWVVGDKPLFMLATGIPRPRTPLRDLSRPSVGDGSCLAEYAAQAFGDRAWDTDGVVSKLHAVYLTEELRSHRTYRAACCLCDPGWKDAFKRPDVAQTLLRWNQPECSFLAGPAESFTEKDHHYVPGGHVRKSIVLLNDHRRAMNVRWAWRVIDPDRENAEIVAWRRGTSYLPSGGRQFVPVVFRLSDRIAKTCRRLQIESGCVFANGVEQRDSFDLRIIHGTQPAIDADPGVSLYDPVGLTAAFFQRNRIPYRPYDPATMPPPTGVLVIGREAVGTNGLPWFASLPKGKRVLVFEQRAEILEQVLGFRVQERGTRHFFLRATHPVTEGMADGYFRDWRELSTLLTLHVRPSWCGYPRPPRYRTATRGTVASVLIEKPAKGDWLALLDGGFGLQYSPLLEHREGDDLYLFCQLDVTGRTFPDPVGDLVAVRCLAYLTQSRLREAETSVASLGNPMCEKWLRAFRLTLKPFTQETSLLLAGKGDPPPAALDVQVEEGLNVLCLGMEESEIRRWSPVPVEDVYTNAVVSRIEEPDAALRGLDKVCGTIALVRHGKGTMVFWQIPPDCLGGDDSTLCRLEQRRANVAFGRLLANLGITLRTPLETRFARPQRKAWLQSYYVDEPQDTDDPYR